MRFTTALLAITAFTSVHAEARCNADNCARQVTGTFQQAPNQASRLADCGSYQVTTTTPPTVTSTSTVTSYTTPNSMVIERDVPAGLHAGRKHRRATQVVTTSSTTPAATVPVYASSCNPSRYQSACSCAGITSATVTAPAPVTTTTTTVTLEATTA